MTGRPGMVAGLRLVRLVGQGGEGEVWEARDADGRRRALKLVRPEALAAPEEVSRRGAWLTRIDHPSLVRVHRTGWLAGSSLDGWGFVEMAFVDGQPLSTAPADPGVLTRLRPLAEALDLLHTGAWSDGVPLVHRDVKPANLIATPGGEVVLVDCSSLRGADATQLTRIGTPVFCAPEVLTGRIGPAADVYSFAVTVVALVTGARGSELAALLDDAWRLDLPEAVALALSERPGDRPASCRAVLESGVTIRLPVVDDEPEADDDSEPAPVWSWCVVLGIVLGLAVAALTLRDPWPLALAAATHLSAHLVGRRRLLAALALPPLAWGLLLADRALVPGPRRTWLRGVLIGALTGALAGGVSGAWQSSTTLAVGALAFGFGLTLVAIRLAWADGAASAVARTLLLPVWLVGAPLLLFAGHDRG